MKKSSPSTSDLPLFSGVILTPDEEAAWRILSERRGRDHAISKRRLAHEMGVSERRARKAIRSLIEHDGLPIGSSYDSKRGGYYLIDDADELAAVIKQLRGHGISILVRAARLNGNNADRLAGQLEVLLNESGV